MKNQMFCLFLCVVFSGLVACAGANRMETGQTIKDQSVLQLAKPIPWFSFVNGATSAGKALKYQADKPDHLSKSVSCNKKVDFAASVQILLKDEQTIIITATTNSDATTAKAIADFKKELEKQFAN